MTVVNFGYNNLSDLGNDLGGFLDGLLSGGLIKWVIILTILGGIAMFFVNLFRGITVPSLHSGYRSR